MSVSDGAGIGGVSGIGRVLSFMRVAAAGVLLRFGVDDCTNGSKYMEQKFRIPSGIFPCDCMPLKSTK
jgi:hypothetical protein